MSNSDKKLSSIEESVLATKRRKNPLKEETENVWSRTDNSGPYSVTGVLPTADEVATKQHIADRKAGLERRAHPEADPNVKEFIEQTASEKSRALHYDVVDRRGLAKILTEAKKTGCNFKVGRSSKNGYRYSIDITPTYGSKGALDRKTLTESVDDDTAYFKAMKNAYNALKDRKTAFGAIYGYRKGDGEFVPMLSVKNTQRELMDAVKALKTRPRGQTDVEVYTIYADRLDNVADVLRKQGVLKDERKRTVSESRHFRSGHHRPVREDLKLYTSSLKDFKPSEEAEELWNEIVDSGKLEDLERGLENVFRDNDSDDASIDLEGLNDLLANHPDFIRTLISLDEKGEIDTDTIPDYDEEPVGENEEVFDDEEEEEDDDEDSDETDSAFEDDEDVEPIDSLTTDDLLDPDGDYDDDEDYEDYDDEEEPRRKPKPNRKPNRSRHDEDDDDLEEGLHEARGSRDLDDRHGRDGELERFRRELSNSILNANFFEESLNENLNEDKGKKQRFKNVDDLFNRFLSDPKNISLINSETERLSRKKMGEQLDEDTDVDAFRKQLQNSIINPDFFSDSGLDESVSSSEITEAKRSRKSPSKMTSEEKDAEKERLARISLKRMTARSVDESVSKPARELREDEDDEDIVTFHCDGTEEDCADSPDDTGDIYDRLDTEYHSTDDALDSYMDDEWADNDEWADDEDDIPEPLSYGPESDHDFETFRDREARPAPENTSAPRLPEDEPIDTASVTPLDDEDSGDFVESLATDYVKNNRRTQTECVGESCTPTSEALDDDDEEVVDVDDSLVEQAVGLPPQQNKPSQPNQSNQPAQPNQQQQQNQVGTQPNQTQNPVTKNTPEEEEEQK